MDEDNILGISVLVGIFGTMTCCGSVFIYRNFMCIDNNDTIVNQNTLLDHRLNDIT